MITDAEKRAADNLRREIVEAINKFGQTIDHRLVPQIEAFARMNWFDDFDESRLIGVVKISLAENDYHVSES